LNKYKPHLLVLPEDDANRQLANGFVEHLNINHRAIQILPEARGWENALDELEKNYSSRIQKYPDCIFVLMIDFDNSQSRLQYAKGRVPQGIEERVFILGVFSAPEKLRKALSLSFEKIGETLADECVNERQTLWTHQLLEHNQDELIRIAAVINSFLFTD
jgi:hypothetical protein